MVVVNEQSKRGQAAHPSASPAAPVVVELRGSERLEAAQQVSGARALRWGLHQWLVVSNGVRERPNTKVELTSFP